MTFSMRAVIIIIIIYSIFPVTLLYVYSLIIHHS